MRYIETSHIKIADIEAKLEGANELIDDYIFDVGLKEKDALRLRLLSEEVLRLAKSIIGYGIMEGWAIIAVIHLISAPDTRNRLFRSFQMLRFIVRTFSVPFIRRR